MVSLFAKPLSKLGFLTSSITRREAIVAALTNRVSELRGFATLGELRDAADLKSMDLLLIDITSDCESKLRFAQTIHQYQAVKICAIGPPKATELRKRACQHGMSGYVLEPISADALIKALARLWNGRQTAQPSTATTSQPAGVAAQRLTQRLGQVKS
ncbi:response regulator [Spiribacter pallidus]|jgi:DNA-binding NarL/FixJ family response regulator|uniref:hypothetical protein n=1 Tax=Spiribacter pallidus TaxID=1987936 RepID=UPI0034A03C56